MTVPPSALRPLPGGARMYPETDIPIQEITTERWGKEICANLPLSSVERMKRLSALDISSNQAEAILNAEMDDILFDGIEENYHFLPRRGRVLCWSQAYPIFLLFL